MGSLVGCVLLAITVTSAALRHSHAPKGRLRHREEAAIRPIVFLARLGMRVLRRC